MIDKIDVLAFGTHPDDIELGCGGTLIKLSSAGHLIVLVDMTQGEMGTRGTVEIRQQEAATAAKIIGAVTRENLGLEDGNINITPEAKRKVVEIVRKYRPSLVLIPYGKDRHPDHYRTSELAYEGIFTAGLHRYNTGQAAYRPLRLLYYMGWQEFTPSVIIDISAQFKRKMEAIYAYSTQFKPDNDSYPPTRLTSGEYNRSIKTRSAYYGSLINKEYGEGFLIQGNIEAENLLDIKFTSF
ncbi:bacillithiol biosynthesis deacetylase BshB1 [Candidatus Acetothermia bacterium]|nr:bacillithiol biosynthesis deacetylase BshB1 [Candidatus Acetothermia bacterium]